MDKPCAAPAVFPYPHRTVAEVDAGLPPLEAMLLAALNGEWRTLKSTGLRGNTRHLIGPAQRLRSRGLIEDRLAGGSLVWRRVNSPKLVIEVRAL